MTEQEQVEILESFAAELLEGMREPELNLTDEQFLEAFGPVEPETERAGIGFAGLPPPFSSSPKATAYLSLYERPRAQRTIA